MVKFNYSATQKIERTHSIEGKILSVDVSSVDIKGIPTPKYIMQIETSDGTIKINCLKNTIKGDSRPNIMLHGYATVLGTVATLTNTDGVEYEAFNTRDLTYIPTKLSQLASAGLSVNLTADLFN